MSDVKVYARFRRLSSKDGEDNEDRVCVRKIDSEAFFFELYQDDKRQVWEFRFDGVFYVDSAQADVYNVFLPIVKDAVNGKNGTIIFYGQKGAGKTYSVEGPSILDCDGSKKGLLPRVVKGMFESINSADESTTYTIKFSMIEICKDRIRDLLDLTKGNLIIEKNTAQELFLSGMEEITISDLEGALKSLSGGIVNRAVGENQMNMASSGSHCIYIFIVQQESTRDKREKAGKLVLVDLAEYEKVEETGFLEIVSKESKKKTGLGSEVDGLLLQLHKGNSSISLLCCCSPSPSKALKTLSTLQFSSRASTPNVDEAHFRIKETKSEECALYGLKLLGRRFIVTVAQRDFGGYTEALETWIERVTKEGSGLVSLNVSILEKSDPIRFLSLCSADQIMVLYMDPFGVNNMSLVQLLSNKSIIFICDDFSEERITKYLFKDFESGNRTELFYWSYEGLSNTSIKNFKRHGAGWSHGLELIHLRRKTKGGPTILGRHNQKRFHYPMDHVLKRLEGSETILEADLYLEWQIKHVLGVDIKLPLERMKISNSAPLIIPNKLSELPQIWIKYESMKVGLMYLMVSCLGGAPEYRWMEKEKKNNERMVAKEVRTERRKREILKGL